MDMAEFCPGRVEGHLGTLLQDSASWDVMLMLLLWLS